MTRASDPGRLSDTTPESPLGQLLAFAERDVPSDRELGKLADRLGPVLDATYVPTAASGSLLAKVGGAAGVAALVAGGLWVSHRLHAASRAPNKQSSSAVAIATVGDGARAPIAPTPLSSSSASDAESMPKPALSKRGAELIKSISSAAEGPSEPVLLERARRALASSPATALALTNQHAARFPHGVLAQVLVRFAGPVGEDTAACAASFPAPGLCADQFVVRVSRE